MADLKKEYTDIKGITHRVEHSLVTAHDKNSRERIVEELINALTRPDKRMSP